ncbi:MAG: hypothetical protein IJO06_04250 [Thermoguttaceae bacterium]|nr:hypothetical protein [Thermoguttaceae bacterium]
MKNLNVILSSAFLLTAATANVDSTAFAQGFGDYVAPAPSQSAPSIAPLAPQTPPAVSPRSPQAAPTAPAPQSPQSPQFSPTPQASQTPQANATRPLQTSAPVVDAPQPAQSLQPTPSFQSTRSRSPSPNVSSAYSAPNARPTNVPTAVSSQPVRVAQAPSVPRAAQPTQSPRPTQTTQASQPTQTPPTSQSAPTSAKSGGASSVANAFVPPPARYQLSENDRLKLDEFLAHWENFGKGIKQVSCDVHAMEFDGGVLQQDSKKPVAHNWGLFRFKAPNQLLYHIKGEFSYANADSGGEAVWQEGKNELKIVLDGKSLTQYDYENKKAIVYPLAEEEQNLDLTMDNGQFPLFFVAKAETLKNRFYLRLVTPAAKRQSEVWIEAFPRYARDAQQFQSIVVILGLKDMQPTYMRKVGVNGKSKTDLKFERVEVNKGRWTIEGTVDDDWTKEVRSERFSLLRQEAVETNYAQTPNAPAPNAATPTAPVRTATRPDAQKAVR